MKISMYIKNTRMALCITGMIIQDLEGGLVIKILEALFAALKINKNKMIYVY
jgi:hypothetical protein